MPKSKRPRAKGTNASETPETQAQGLALEQAETPVEPAEEAAVESADMPEAAETVEVTEADGPAEEVRTADDDEQAGPSESVELTDEDRQAVQAALEAAAASDEKTGKTEEPVKPDKNSSGFWKLIKENALKNNVVFIRILAITTVLGGTLTLKGGLLLGAMAVAVTIPLYLIMALLFKKVPIFAYFSIALLIAGAIETPLIMLAAWGVPEVTAQCSYFLPLTAINAVLMLDLHVTRGRRQVLRSFAAGIGDVLGYAVVLALISAFRELIGSGSVYGRALPDYAQVRFSFALLPPGAFLLIGLLLAVVQGIQIHHKKSGRGGAR